MVTEALERLPVLIEQFVEESSIELNASSSLLDLTNDCNRSTLNACLQDEATDSILEKYVAFEKKVRAGYLRKTAQFWLSAVDHARLLLLFQYSVKTNNFQLFYKCNGGMAELFFAYDGPNYSKWVNYSYSVLEPH